MKELIVKIEDSGRLIPVAEFIRCKNCRKRREWFCELDGKYHSPEYFCGFAKPKDSEIDD